MKSKFSYQNNLKIKRKTINPMKYLNNLTCQKSYSKKKEPTTINDKASALQTKDKSTKDYPILMKKHRFSIPDNDNHPSLDHKLDCKVFMRNPLTK